MAHQDQAQRELTEMNLHVATEANSPFVAGRRAFLKFRDLGATKASGGRFRAQIITAENGESQPTGWHYHVCDVQLVHMIEGWADMEFEGGKVVHRLSAGDIILIPGGMPHNEARTSATMRALEVSMPADMGTIVCEPSGEQKFPNTNERQFVTMAKVGTDANGRLVAKATTSEGGLDVRFFGNGAGEMPTTSDPEGFRFLYMLGGGAEVAGGATKTTLRAGEAALIPGDFDLAPAAEGLNALDFVVKPAR